MSDPLTIQVSIILNSAPMPEDGEDVGDLAYGLPVSTDKATKAEANYRPAFTDPEVQASARDHARQLSMLARGHIDHMEIPSGLDSREGDHPRTYSARLYRKECGTCVHFGINDCSLVAGMIDHEYVCDWWDDGAAA